MRNLKGWADLHIHSSFSDGEWSPQEIIQEVVRLGLRAIAITDHDSVSAIAKAEKEASTAGIELIPAVEINTDYNDREIHILGYYIDIEYPQLLKALKKQREARLRRNEEIIKRLKKLGFKLTLEEVLERAKGESIGRPHIAQTLVDKGYAESKEEAFSKWLKRDSPAYVPRYSMFWQEAVRIINQAGGIAVLAHPGKSFVDHLIPQMVKEGILGIEVWHPSHCPEDSLHYLEIVRAYSLLATGGSDAHSKKDILLIEQCKVSYERVLALKERKKSLSI
ncbi:PHP domain-containing protein [bacterium]|nr:PHP domain-containing protein [bacterium]